MGRQDDSEEEKDFKVNLQVSQISVDYSMLDMEPKFSENKEQKGITVQIFIKKFSVFLRKKRERSPLLK
jgi:hypothetical protein